LDELVASVPVLVGHHPQESLVFLCLRPPRNRVALTMRIDLPDDADERTVVDHLVEHAAHAGARAVLLLVYTTEQTAEPRRALVDLASVRLRARGLELRDAVLVQGGRFRSYLCRQPECCPPDGRPWTEASAELTAAAALAGTAVLPDRAALVRSVAPVGFLHRAALEQAYDRVAEELAEQVADGRAWTDVRAETLRRFDECLSRYAERTGLDDAEAARLVLGLADIPTRDQILARAGDRDTDALLALLMDLTRRALFPHDAPVAATLAWVAYARGNGALANVAVDRALTSDPDYSLANLLLEGLQRGVHPRQLRRVARRTPRRSVA
jgi:Domain of unknown function (DUF4192)